MKKFKWRARTDGGRRRTQVQEQLGRIPDWRGESGTDYAVSRKPMYVPLR